jgi:hypothetical protein
MKRLTICLTARPTNASVPITVAALCALVLIVPVADAQPLATKGSALTVTLQDAQSATFFASPDQRERLKIDRTQWQPVAEEVLLVGEWLQSPLRAALTDSERAAVRYRSQLADIRAGVDALVQRDMERLRANLSGVEARAKELWLADEGKYFSPTKANVNLLFIDAHKRGLADATAHYQKAIRRLKRGELFAKVAKDLADIVPGQKTQLPIPMVFELRSIEGAARRAIFRDLKVGELSAPIPTPEGWVIAQVLEVKKPERQPFDEVKQPIMEQVLTDAAATARLAVMATLAQPPVVYAKEILPSEEIERNTRAGNTAAAQLVQEMKQRNMTPEAVQKRLEELLELAKRQPDLPVAPPK